MSDFPLAPGIYVFKDVKEKVLYVGKAKNLRNRLRSYFLKSAALEPRKHAMVKLIRDVSFIVTGNELEALILEASLIKQYKPRFNIILRDDKNYPYIRITTAEKWPKIEVVRRVKNDGNLYFGPYIPAQGMWEAFDFIRRHFLIRTCGYSLDKKMRPCIQYQMGRCVAPCSDRISRAEYMKVVEDVRLFLKGEKKELLKKLKNDMHRLSDEMRFEEAARIRDRISNLNKAFESQKIIAPELGDMDIIGSYGEGDEISFQILFLRNGILIGAKDFFIENVLSSDAPEAMHSFIELFYSKDILPPPAVLVSVIPKDTGALASWLSVKKGGRVRIESPSRGKKRELIRMAEDNARIHSNSRKKPPADSLIDELKERLGLEKAPSSIGAFDVSTIQGSESVGAFIYWLDGQFRKDFYRRLRIKEVQGMDDYAMMKEIVGRTLAKTAVSSQQSPTEGAEAAVRTQNTEGYIPLPDLIIIDGGKGQLEIARKAMDELGINTGLVGLAKKPDRAFLLDGRSIDLEDRSKASLLLKKIRDEVHRFVISYHRKLRDKRLTESPLEKVHGIGPKKRLELLRHFTGLENIRKASVEEIASLKGFNRELAEKLLECLSG